MKTLSLGAFALISSQELTGRLYSLRVEERELLVEFLACLGELDKRKLYLELGFTSLFAYCTNHLWQRASEPRAHKTPGCHSPRVGPYV
jgi:hypothetical protein